MASPSIHAAKDDGSACFVEFPSTTAGLQQAIDSLAGGKGKVFIGPGTLDITTVISLHSNCHIQGCGVNVTVIRRATGSLTAADAAPTGSTFIATAYGANGTHPSGVGSVSDITISDLTLDGNQSNFAINPNTPTHFGIFMNYVDGIRIERISVQEHLQGGIKLLTSRKAFINDVWIYKVGQYASASDRNGIDLHDNTGTANYSRDAVITNIVSDTLNDAHFYCDWSNVTYSNITIRGGGQFGFELETKTARPTIDSVVIVNVVADGLTKEFFRMGQLTGSNTTFQDILLRNCNSTFDSTHSGFAIRALNTTNAILRRFKMSGCTFLGCNGSDGANLPYFFFETTNVSTPSQDLTVEDCVFSGALPASTVTSSGGMDIRGHVQKLTIQNNTIRDAQGKGILVRTKSASANVVDCRITNNSVYNCTDDGISVITDSASGVIKRIKLDGNYVEDSCEATGTNGIRVGPQTASTTGQDVHIINNRIVKVSSTLLSRGIRIEAGAASTSDSYILDMNDFTGLSTGSDLEYANTGTSTNVQFHDPVNRGADVASAATVTLKLGTLFHVTGTTAVTTLNPCVTWERRPITFIMDSTALFTDGGNMKLAGNGPNTADDTITMAYDGTSWYEIARAVN